MGEVRELGRRAAGLERIELEATWSDLDLGEDKKAKLRQVLELLSGRALHRGMRGRRDEPGGAILFAGPSGTGKTMAAKILANALGADLFRVDLGLLVSKHIGETEKNINALFDSAEQANAILLFDEADALFGKRTQVQDAHDRYANLDTTYLLERIERFPGIAILTATRGQSLDSAFVRRLATVIDFP